MEIDTGNALLLLRALAALRKAMGDEIRQQTIHKEAAGRGWTRREAVDHAVLCREHSEVLDLIEEVQAYIGGGE